MSGGQDGGTGHERQWTVKDARKGPLAGLGLGLG